MTLALEQLPGGIDALAPTDGALPFEAFSSLAEPLEQARSETALAVEAIRSSPSGALPGPVADARRQALEQVEKVGHALNSWHAFALGLPEFAGGDGPRRYLFFAENPAEPRGTGGLWGAYSILRVNEGRLSFSGFRPVQTLRNLPPDVAPAPNPDYRRNYDRWGAPGYWLNMNMTPDFPSAARAALGTWEAIGREPLDGVLTADPITLKHLLDVTGAIRLSRPPLVVTEGNVVSLLSNRAFARFPDPAIRKALLGDVALAVFDRFLGLDGLVVPTAPCDGPIGRGRTSEDLHRRSDRCKRPWSGAGLDSGLRPAGGDLLGVVVNAGAGGKVDFFAQRSVHHEVTLLPDSDSTATHHHHDRERRADVGAAALRHRSCIAVEPATTSRCSRCSAADAAGWCGLNVTAIESTSSPALSWATPTTRTTSRSRPKGTGVLTVRTETPGSWEGDASGGSYRLTILGQTTIRPTPANIRISAPDGMAFTTWSEGIQIRNHTATWEGVLQGRLELEVSFEAPSLPVRLWRAIFDRF